MFGKENENKFNREELRDRTLVALFKTVYDYKAIKSQLHSSFNLRKQ